MLDKWPLMLSCHAKKRVSSFTFFFFLSSCFLLLLSFFFLLASCFFFLSSDAWVPIWDELFFAVRCKLLGCFLSNLCRLGTLPLYQFSKSILIPRLGIFDPSYPLFPLKKCPANIETCCGDGFSWWGLPGGWSVGHFYRKSHFPIHLHYALVFTPSSYRNLPYALVTLKLYMLLFIL